MQESKFGYKTFWDSVIRLLYQSAQTGLCYITNNPKISMNASSIYLFLSHDICSFLVISSICLFVCLLCNHSGTWVNREVTFPNIQLLLQRKSDTQGSHIDNYMVSSEMVQVTFTWSHWPESALWPYSTARGPSAILLCAQKVKS